LVLEEMCLEADCIKSIAEVDVMAIPDVANEIMLKMKIRIRTKVNTMLLFIRDSATSVVICDHYIVL
jgi:hypothetical protein